MSLALWKRLQHRAVDMETSASDLVRKYVIRGLRQDQQYTKARSA